jgi:DNA-binding response OmpR family regulator
MSYIRLRMRLLVALADKPDIIIMDVRLAGAGDGIAAACEILARTGIRSIFATAHADEETRARGSVACPVAWLEKPFGVESVLQAVRLAFQDRGE